eukprot:scaffold93352_cov30-Attheya_sp.AAC.1
MEESAASDKETSSSRTAAIASESGSAVASKLGSTEKDNEGKEVVVVSRDESIVVRRSHWSGVGVVAGLKTTGLNNEEKDNDSGIIIVKRGDLSGTWKSNKDIQALSPRS